MTKHTETVSDLRKLSQTELAAKIKEARIKVQELNNQLAIGKLKNFSEVSKLRKHIARMRTFISEKNILEEALHGEA